MSPYRLEKVETKNSLERHKLEEDTVLLQQRLVLLIEPKRADYSDHSSVRVQDRDPDMGKVHTVGLLAVCASSQRDGSCNPEDNTSRNELEHTVPCFLLIVR